MQDKYSELVIDVIKHVKSIKNFSPDQIYLDSPINPKLNEEDIVSDKKEDYKKSPDALNTAHDLFGNKITLKEDWESSVDLSSLNELICNCLKCPLGKTRNKFVFGVGDPKAEIMLVGEAPGADEDMQGFPFVGRAGQLLNKIIEAGGYKRESVYICNILKCRPPGNRNPLPEEVEKCKPYLDKQIQLIKPKIILALGRVAAESLLRTKLPLNKLRGKVHNYNGIKTIVTFHPAALLRNPEWKKPTWDDIQFLNSEYKKMK